MSWYQGGWVGTRLDELVPGCPPQHRLLTCDFFYQLSRQLLRWVGKAAGNVLCQGVFSCTSCVHKLSRQLLQWVGKAAGNVLCQGDLFIYNSLLAISSIIHAHAHTNTHAYLNTHTLTLALHVIYGHCFRQNFPGSVEMQLKRSKYGWNNFNRILTAHGWNEPCGWNWTRQPHFNRTSTAF
jgi:hypothetical protein